MALHFYLIDISAVESDQDRSSFNEHQLTELANSLITSDDLIHPILVTQINPVRFKVLHGHFEYYAAVKANEIDPTFDEIRAIIVPDHLKEVVLKQHQLLIPPIQIIDPDPVLTLNDLGELEKKLEHLIQEQVNMLYHVLSAQQQAESLTLKGILESQIQMVLDRLPNRKKPPKLDQRLSISEINSLKPVALQSRMGEMPGLSFLDSQTMSLFLDFIESNRPFDSFATLSGKVGLLKKPKPLKGKLITKANLEKIVRDS